MSATKSAIENECYIKNVQHRERAQTNIANACKSSLPQSLQDLIPFRMDESSDINEVCDFLRNSSYSDDYQELNCYSMTKLKDEQREQLFKTTAVTCRYSQNMECIDPESLSYLLGEPLQIGRFGGGFEEENVAHNFKVKLEELEDQAATTQSPSPKFTPKPDHEEEEDEEEEEEAEEEEEEARTTDEDEIPKIKQEPLSPGNPIRRRKTAIGSKQARKRRTRKNLLKPGSQLYQFILQLLDDKDKEQFIRWVRQSEGVFRIVKKEEVAKLWGEFKNRRMSYDSLSRGLRHYYQQGLLNSVSKKLHYQFTKKALDYWNEIRDKDSIEEL